MKNWELRKSLMMWETYPELRLAIAIAVDHFDWNTNIRVFETKTQYNAWIYGLSKRFNISPQVMKEAMQVLKEAGVIEQASTGGEGKAMRLREPTHKDEALAAFEERLKERDKPLWTILD